MPTRFPKGLNTNIQPRNPLFQILNTSTDIGEWGVKFTDFTDFSGFQSHNAGTNSITTATTHNNHGVFGSTNFVTAGAANTDMAGIFSQAGAANTMAGICIMTSTVKEWVFAARVGLSSTGDGFWCGFGSAGDLIAGAALVDNNATTLVNAAFFRKASGSTDITAEVNASSTALIPSTVMVAAASVAVSSTSWYELIMHKKDTNAGAVLNLYLGTSLVNSGTNYRKIASSVMIAQWANAIPMGLVFAGRADGAAITARTIRYDYGLLAMRVPTNR